MARRTTLDAVDRNILRILSKYDHLTPLQVWYEMGEDDAVREAMTEEEITGRLESLRGKGLIERVTPSGSAPDSLHYRIAPHAVPTDKRPPKRG